MTRSAKNLVLIRGNLALFIREERLAWVGKIFDGFFIVCYNEKKWRDVRVVEGGGLENRCPLKVDRGFESYSLRQEI